MRFVRIFCCLLTVFVVTGECVRAIHRQSYRVILDVRLVGVGVGVVVGTQLVAFLQMGFNTK